MTPQLAALLGNAEAQHRAGHFDAAIAGYGAALAMAPAHRGARLMHAMALAESGRLEAALAAVDAAFAVLGEGPDADLVGLRGICLMELGRLDAALAGFEMALAMRPHDFGLRYNHATVLKRLGRNAEALAGFDAAIACNAAVPDAHNNRGVTLDELGRRDEAIASYDRALAVAPQHVDALINRGLAFQAQADLAAALDCFERAVIAAPLHAKALQVLGDLLVIMRQPRQAAACFDRLLEVAPATLALLQNRRHCLMCVADWDGFDADIAEIGARLGAGETGGNPFMLAALIDDPVLLRAVAAAPFGEATAESQPAPPPMLPTTPRPAGGERLRIGYFSADFREHPVMLLLAEVIEAHDRQRFETIGFSFGPVTGDAWQRRAMAGFDRFIDVRQLSEAAIVAEARALGIDIAIDLMGFTAQQRAGIFVARAAPVQVNFLGYPGTFGGSCMDYIVGDEVLIPPAQLAGYSEKLAWLPDTYQPSGAWAGPVTPATRAECGLPARGVVFAAVHQIFKVLPETFARWVAIVRGVDDSVLWMRADDEAVRARLRGVAGAQGLSADRLVFSGGVDSRVDYLRRLAAADLFLDTLPYNAHATASDVLRAGLPLLTLPGRGYAARVGASLLTLVGLPELIAADSDDFVARGIALGNDPARLAGLRQRLAATLPISPLFDPARFTRHIEAAFEAMVARQRDGLAPDHIRVAPAGR